MDWKTALTSSGRSFMQEIVDQVPESNGTRAAFEVLLNNLVGYVSDDVQKKLDKLQALENNGVDNWEYYDDAMAELNEDEDEDEDD